MCLVSAVLIVVAKSGGASTIVFADTITPQQPRCLSEIVPSPALRFWCHPTKGIREPFTIDLIVSATCLVGIMTMWRSKFRRRAVASPFKWKTRNFMEDTRTQSLISWQKLREFANPRTLTKIPLSAFRELLKRSAFAAIKAWLTMSSNDVSRHDGTITTYVKVASHVRRHYVTSTVIAKANE